MQEVVKRVCMQEKEEMFDESGRFSRWDGHRVRSVREGTSDHPGGGSLLSFYSWFCSLVRP